MSTEQTIDVWHVLSIQAPTPATKQQVTVNNRHNRTIRINVIKLIVKSFARLNDEDQTNFGFIKAYLDGKRFYYGVCASQTGVDIKPLKSYPTGIIEAMLEQHWLDNNGRAVGIIIKGGKVLPIINEGDHLVVGAWK